MRNRSENVFSVVPRDLDAYVSTSVPVLYEALKTADNLKHFSLGTRYNV